MLSGPAQLCTGGTRTFPLLRFVLEAHCTGGITKSKYSPYVGVVLPFSAYGVTTKCARFCGVLKQKNTPVGTHITHIFSTKSTIILILRFRLLSWSVPVPHCLWRHNKDNHFLYWDLVIDHDRKHLPVLFNLAPRQKRFQECSIKWHLEGCTHPICVVSWNYLFIP